MNNKILKQNAIMILYITNVIDELDKNIKHIEQECSYRSKYIDIRVNKELKRYFEKCLEEVLNVCMEKD
nr:MAG TPA: hypothetical protein [Bacteriophage sp.]